MLPSSIPGILDATIVRGTRAAGSIDLVIEVPHGATTTADYTALAVQLTSPLPDDLIAFFHVNTDAGAPELAVSIAERLVAEQPQLSVAVLRCRIPRTFIDCNRRIAAAAADFKAGKVTPGLMPWIATDDDRALLRSTYDRYVAAVSDALGELDARGALLMLHSYAPRTVDVEVDRDIAIALRRAYQLDQSERWPIRPEVDVISRDTTGVDHAPAGVVAALRAELAAAGIALADSATYPLHPSTLAWHHTMARPGRALCVEVRRDLLADPFDPFAEMRIGAAKLGRLAPPFARALARWWTAPPPEAERQ